MRVYLSYMYKIRTLSIFPLSPFNMNECKISKHKQQYLSATCTHAQLEAARARWGAVEAEGENRQRVVVQLVADCQVGGFIVFYCIFSYLFLVQRRDVGLYRWGLVTFCSTDLNLFKRCRVNF